MREGKLRIGIIGTGKISATFVDAVRRTEGVEAAAVLSRTPARGAEFCRENGLTCPAFSDRAAFFASDIDAVYIASPNSCHAADVAEAACAGKHILCEKPIAPTHAQYIKMKEASDRAGVVLLEAFRHLHDAAFSVLRENLPRLGRLQGAHFSYCQYSSRYDAFLGGQTPRAFDPAYGNAALLDIGIYPLSLAIALLGEPQTVSAASTFLCGGFEGEGCATLGYGDCEVELEWSKIRDSAAPSFIRGESGSLRLDRVSRPTGLTLIRPDGQEESLAYTAPENNMVFELAAFREMVAGRADTRPFAEISEATVRALDRLRASAGIILPVE